MENQGQKCFFKHSIDDAFCYSGHCVKILKNLQKRPRSHTNSLYACDIHNLEFSTSSRYFAADLMHALRTCLFTGHTHSLLGAMFTLGARAWAQNSCCVHTLGALIAILYTGSTHLKSEQVLTAVRMQCSGFYITLWSLLYMAFFLLFYTVLLHEMRKRKYG